jgi:hypothetical protein
MAAVFLMGVAVFTPPLLAVASHDLLIGGIPLLYLWLFGCWLVLIAALALAAEGPGGED